MSIKGRVAIVTGGAKGNGKGIVKALAAQGARVIILGHADKMEETTNEMQALGYDVTGRIVDVCDKPGLEREINDIIKSYGKIDILVNNAGILRTEPFVDISDESRDQQMDVNIKGTWNPTQLVLPYMVKEHYGRIINLSSVTGAYVCDPGSVCYAMTKAAIIGFTKGLAVEYAEKGITVNALCPGWIKTPMVEAFAKEEQPENPDGLLSKLAMGLPVKRLGLPEDIGYLTACLAGDEADFITGAAIVIDGGSILPES